MIAVVAGAIDQNADTTGSAAVGATFGSIGIGPSEIDQDPDAGQAGPLGDVLRVGCILLPADASTDVLSSAVVCLSMMRIFLSMIFADPSLVEGSGPQPTNATTAIINRICFMPATLRLPKRPD